MERIKGYIVIAFLTMCMVFVLSMFVIKDQYDKELTELRLNNKKLSYELKRVKKDNKMMTVSIEYLQQQVDGKKAIECDCAWYEDFYYEHMKEVGANE